MNTVLPGDLVKLPVDQTGVGCTATGTYSTDVVVKHGLGIVLSVTDSTIGSGHSGVAKDVKTLRDILANEALIAASEHPDFPKALESINVHRTKGGYAFSTVTVMWSGPDPNELFDPANPWLEVVQRGS